MLHVATQAAFVLLGGPRPLYILILRRSPLPQQPSIGSAKLNSGRSIHDFESESLFELAHESVISRLENPEPLHLRV